MNKFNTLALIAIISLSIVIAQTDEEIGASEKMIRIQQRCKMHMDFYRLACSSSSNPFQCKTELRQAQNCYGDCLNDTITNFSVCRLQCQPTNYFLINIFEILQRCLNK